MLKFLNLYFLRFLTVNINYYCSIYLEGLAASLNELIFYISTNKQTPWSDPKCPEEDVALLDMTGVNSVSRHKFPLCNKF